MSQEIKLFEQKQIRTSWNEQEEKWYFSVVDVVQVLTDSPNPRKYWSVLKTRLKTEGGELTTICSQLKMQSHTDGKYYLTDVADTEQMLRIIQSIPSKKAEPFKRWLAAVGAERLRQLQDPELSIEQAVADYRRLGYSETWINRRIKTIEIRKGLTDEWKRGGIDKESDYALLTDLMSKTWSGLTTREYKDLKGLHNESLRDNMTNMELLLNALAEESATQISKERNPDGLVENARVAKEGADVAKNARTDLEKRLGHSIVSSEKAIDYIQPKDELPFKNTGNHEGE